MRRERQRRRQRRYRRGARGVQRASVPPMELPDYEGWRATCDTLHAHTQVLGKLAAVLAPPEPQLQHAALRLTVRGWETLPLPAPDGSGAFSLILDLHAHEAVVDHVDGRGARIPLTPHRSVGAVTRDVLEAVRELVGDVPFDAQPQEVPWTVALDADEEHATLRRGAGRRVPRRGVARGADPRRVPRAVPRPLDPGERLVGLVRPRREPVLGRARPAAVGRLHHAQRDGRAGGRRRLVAGRRALRQGRVLRLRAPGARRPTAAPRSSPPPRAGTASSASTCSTGTT